MQSAFEKFNKENRSIVVHGDCYFQPMSPNVKTFAYELCLIARKTDLLEAYLIGLPRVSEISVQTFMNEVDKTKSELSHLLDKLSTRWFLDEIELENVFIDEEETELFGFVGRISGRTDLRIAWVDVSALAVRNHGSLTTLFSESPPSLFPPVWSHCLSFWESPAFDEVVFLNLILSFCWQVIRKVELVEVYEDADGRKSRCYRIVHQSFTFPLTKKASNDIQYALRTFLENQLKIVPR